MAVRGGTMVSFANPARGNGTGGVTLPRELLLNMPAAVAYVTGPDLVYQFANEEYQRMVGGRELVGLALRDALPELSQERLAAIQRVAQGGEPVRGHESERWIRRGGRELEQLFVDFVYQPVRDESGDVVGVLLYGSDVTGHVRDRQRLEVLAGRLAATEERYRTLFETLPEGVIHYNADGSILGANPAAGEILGLDPEAMTSWPLGQAGRALHEDGSPYQPAELPVLVALRTGETVADEVVGMPHGRTGELRWLRVTVVPDARDERGRPQRAYAMFADITEQRQAEAARQQAERERAALLAREEVARTAARAAQERLSFLLRAGDLVAATRNRDDLLEKVTQLVVPALADYCVAFMPVGGMLRATKLTHHDPAGAEVLKRLRDHPIPSEGPLISQIAYTTGTTQLASEFSASHHAWATAAPELMSVVGEASPVSAVAVPLLDRKRPFGVLVLGRTEPRPRFTEADVAVVEELARRLAAGLANAETFAREHTVAQTLQYALLPTAMPKIEGLDLAVRYLAASDGVHVGGDWYDAFPVHGGRIGLVIGDVAGHSIDSASVMGQIRSLLRGYAIDNPAPHEVLRRTNTAITRLLPEAFATACYAVLDPVTSDLVYATAGHPPPLYTSDHGPAEYLDESAGTMLGACADATYTAGHRRLAPGATLLFYTDGLIEHRDRELTEGLAALRTVLQRTRGQTAEQTCQSVQAALLGVAPRTDDVCILAARLSRQVPRTWTSDYQSWQIKPVTIE